MWQSTRTRSRWLVLFVAIWLQTTPAFAAAGGAVGATTADTDSTRARLRGGDSDLPPPPPALRMLQGNSNPIARDDNAETPFNTNVLISVLVNDNDPDPEPISVVSHTDPENGSAVINTQSPIENTITYTPNQGFVGVDSFLYTITDGRGGFGEARVTINVLPPPSSSNNNQPPNARDDVGIMTAINTAVVIDALGNDDDPDGDALTITAVTQPSDGTATINGSGDVDQTITYTPNTNFTGNDRFSYTISDGNDNNGGTDTAFVEVRVVAGSFATSPPVTPTTTSPPPPPTAAPTAPPPPVATPAPTSALGLPQQKSCLPAFAQCRQNSATCFSELGNFETGGWYNALDRDQPIIACDLWIQMPNDCSSSGGTIVGTVTGTATYDAETLNARYYFTYNMTDTIWEIEAVHVNADIFKPVPTTVSGEYNVNPDFYSISRTYDPMQQNATGAMRVRCPKDFKGYVNTIFYANVCSMEAL